MILASSVFHLPIRLLAIIVSFSYIYILYGSVSTPLRCGGIFTNHFIANFPTSVPVKEFRKSVNIWQRYGQYQVRRFLDTVYNSLGCDTIPYVFHDKTHWYGRHELMVYMPQASLQLVFDQPLLPNSSMPPLLGEALPMLARGKIGGFWAFLRWAGKSGYYTGDSLPTVAALCEQADEQLFRSIKRTPRSAPSSTVTTWA